MLRKSFFERAQLSANGLTKELLLLMHDKKTNLCLSVDSEKTQEILQIADEIGPYIAILKLHSEIILDFNKEFISDLISLSKKHKFLLFEDRKFSDIGAIVKKQYEQSYFRIKEWAHLITTHIISGPGSIEALDECITPGRCGVLLVAQMSCKNNLITKEYTNFAVSLANQFPNVIGFIAQSRITEDSNFLHFTPGVSMLTKNDHFDQNYKTPEEAILNGADIIIVGRGITGATSKLNAAMQFRNSAFNAYEKMNKS